VHGRVSHDAHALPQLRGRALVPRGGFRAGRRARVRKGIRRATPRALARASRARLGHPNQRRRAQLEPVERGGDRLVRSAAQAERAGGNFYRANLSGLTVAAPLDYCAGARLSNAIKIAATLNAIEASGANMPVTSPKSSIQWSVTYTTSP